MINWKIASLRENHVFERRNLIHFPLLRHLFYLFIIHLPYKIFVEIYEVLQLLILNYL